MHRSAGTRQLPAPISPTERSIARYVLILETCSRNFAKALQSHAKSDPRRCVPGLGCLTVCGLRDGIAAAGQFCIATRLGDALRGELKKGLFFRGSEPLPFGSAIRPVSELLEYLLTGDRPAPV